MWYSNWLCSLFINWMSKYMVFLYLFEILKGAGMFLNWFVVIISFFLFFLFEQFSGSKNLSWFLTNLPEEVFCPWKLHLGLWRHWGGDKFLGGILEMIFLKLLLLYHLTFFWFLFAFFLSSFCRNGSSMPSINSYHRDSYFSDNIYLRQVWVGACTQKLC